MKKVKVYSLKIGESYYGAGGETFFYRDKESRDTAASGVHPMDNPIKGEFEAPAIDGAVYFPTSEIKFAH